MNIHMLLFVLGEQLNDLRLVCKFLLLKLCVIVLLAHLTTRKLSLSTENLLKVAVLQPFLPFTLRSP
jgi:hypothetical protein